MKDNAVIVLLCLAILLSIVNNIAQDKQIIELQHDLDDMCEQIAYIEKEMRQ